MLYFPYYIYSNNQIINGTYAVKPEAFSDIVKNIENRIYRETTNILIDLKFGGIIETIFEDTKKLVDSKLIDVCPDAIEKFTSAYERLKETNPESWAQAFTTCRRILKDFEDENIKSDTNKKLIQSELEYTGRHNSRIQLCSKNSPYYHRKNIFI